MSRDEAVVEFTNRLTPAEDERLAMLLEELGESIQVIGKIQRHGYESFDPTKADPPTNRHMLEKELGDVFAIVELLVTAGDLDGGRIRGRVYPKLRKLARYEHHQSELIDSILNPEFGRVDR